MKINRRKFLSISSSLPLGLLSSNNLNGSNESNYLLSLIHVLLEQAELHNDVLHPEQIKNLNNAYKRIEPETHHEKAFVVACGMSCMNMKYVVDEFIRRKRNFIPPIYSIIDNKKYALPDTHGILIFKEQYDSLLSELSNENMGCKKLYKLILEGKFTFDFFLRIIREEHIKTLGIKKFKSLYGEMCFLGSAGFYPYSWCSEMVNRAEILFSS